MALLSLVVIAAACADSFGDGDSAGTAEPTSAPADDVTTDRERDGSGDTESLGEEPEPQASPEEPQDEELSAEGERDSFDADAAQAYATTGLVESARTAVDLSTDDGALNQSTTVEETDPGEPAELDPEEPSRPPTDLTALLVGRDLIFNGKLEMRVDDVDAAADAAVDAISDIGLIFDLEKTLNPTPRTVLTFKVRPADFDVAMARIKSGVGGTLANEEITTDDVTERVVDLESRITTAELSVERTRALLADARDLNTIRALEEELLERETVLEVLRGQLKTLQDQVALATITVTITQKSASDLEAALELTTWLGASVDEACPGSSELEIEGNSNVVLCVEVENTGDDVLTEIDIEIPTFNLRVDDLRIRDQGSTEAVDPGDRLTAVVVLEAEDRFIRRRDISDGTNVTVVVTAVPAGDDEAELQAEDILYLSASSDDSLPGFGDSLDNGWGAFVTVVSVVMIAMGLLFPFLPFIALFIWWARRSYLKGLDAAYPAAESLPDESEVAEPV